MNDTTLEKLLEQCQERMENIFGQCGTWVKASERKPINRDYHFIKIKEAKGIAYYHEVYDLFIENPGEKYSCNEVEWLDEPNNNSAKITFAFKELFDFAKNDL